MSTPEVEPVVDLGLGHTAYLVEPGDGRADVAGLDGGPDEWPNRFGIPLTVQ